MLEVQGLSVRYGPVLAVDNVTVSIAEGECVGLLGPNGAGKTSTLEALSGLLKYDGSVRFEGRSLNGMRAGKIARLGLIHVPEGRRTFPSLTVHENLQVASAARAARPAIYTVDEIYQLFPALVELRRRGAWALSGGEQQMLALGRALVGAPRLLMLDEPSLGLAPVMVDIVMQALRDIRHKVTVVLVEQNSALALKICDRCVVLSGGQIALEGTAAELQERGDLLETYLEGRGADSAFSSEEGSIVDRSSTEELPKNHTGRLA